MEVLENTKNDLQIDLRLIDCCVITLTNELGKLRAQYATNPLKKGMYVIFPWFVIVIIIWLRLSTEPLKNTQNDLQIDLK